MPKNAHIMNVVPSNILTGLINLISSYSHRHAHHKILPRVPRTIPIMCLCYRAPMCPIRQLLKCIAISPKAMVIFKTNNKYSVSRNGHIRKFCYGQLVLILYFGWKSTNPLVTSVLGLLRSCHKMRIVTTSCANAPVTHSVHKTISYVLMLSPILIALFTVTRVYKIRHFRVAYL